MPLVDANTESEVFDTTETVLNRVRVLINDAQGGIQGQILADNQPYTWTLLQLVYEKLANWLEDSNVETATYEQIDVSLPASQNITDPNAQSNLSRDGFTDAAGSFYEQPTLPDRMIQPLFIWQKPTGIQQPYQEMRQQLGGLNPDFTGGYLSRWEYRQNAIYFAGGPIVPTDIRIRFITSFPRLVMPTGDQPYPTIFFARTGVAFAYLIAAEYQEIRNAPNAPMLRLKANQELQIIANKAAKRASASQTRARGYGFGGYRGRGSYRVYG